MGKMWALVVFELGVSDVASKVRGLRFRVGTSSLPNKYSSVFRVWG